jgi:putative transposase
MLSCRYANAQPTLASIPATARELRSSKVFNPKLDYIHYNPVKAGLCKLPEDYYYSSAKFYFDGVDAFEMLTQADE